MKFFTVDVFARQPFSGNQVAVFLVDDGLKNKISENLMKKIAGEMNFREVVFLETRPNGDKSYNIRIFGPEKEIEFSGHSVLGTAYIILRKLGSYVSLKEQSDNADQEPIHGDFNRKVLIKLPESLVEVYVQEGSPGVNTEERNAENRQELRNERNESEYADIPDKMDTHGDRETFWIREGAPEFGKTFERVLLSRILSIEPELIDDRFPIIEVNTGLPMIVVPIKSLATMKGMLINKQRYNWLIAQTYAKCILAFSTETLDDGNDVHVRVFADFFGIPEDPATGSGNGGLVAYIHRYNILPEKEKDGHLCIRIEQGYEIGRPSLVYARCIHPKSEMVPQIQVGGNVVLISEGEMHI